MFDPNKLLDIAKKMDANTPYLEEEGRTAVNRAYYSAFLVARDRAHQLRPDIVQFLEKEHVHAKVMEAYDELGEKSISSQLLTLAKKRGLADYNLNCIIKKGDVQKSIALAQNIISEVNGV